MISGLPMAQATIEVHAGENLRCVFPQDTSLKNVLPILQIRTAYKAVHFSRCILLFLICEQINTITSRTIAHNIENTLEASL